MKINTINFHEKIYLGPDQVTATNIDPGSKDIKLTALIKLRRKSYFLGKDYIKVLRERGV